MKVQKSVMEMKRKPKKRETVIVSWGMYSLQSTEITINWTTERGLIRRMRQLAKKHAFYNDIFHYMEPAKVTIASPLDKWRDNFFGDRQCIPAHEWLPLKGPLPKPGVTQTKFLATL